MSGQLQVLIVLYKYYSITIIMYWNMLYCSLTNECGWNISGEHLVVADHSSILPLPEFLPRVQIGLPTTELGKHRAVQRRYCRNILSLQIFVIDHELWLEEVICWYCPCIFFHLPWTMTGRWYLWVLSLQIFVIDPGTLAGRGYLWVLSLHFCCNFFLL